MRLNSRTDAIPEISVVIPVYNNQRTLHELIRQLMAVLHDEVFELLFVDDCSRDDSLALLRDAAAHDERIGVVSLSANVGQNQAIVTGFGYVRGSLIVVMDADLQDSPQAVPLLLDVLRRTDSAAVFARRVGRYSTWPRSLTSRGFKLVLSLLSGFRLPIGAGLFVVLKYPVVRQLITVYRPQGYILSFLARLGQFRYRAVSVGRAPQVETNYTGAMRRSLALRAIRDAFPLLPPSKHAAPLTSVELIGRPFAHRSEMKNDSD